MLKYKSSESSSTYGVRAFLNFNEIKWLTADLHQAFICLKSAVFEVMSLLIRQKL